MGGKYQKLFLKCAAQGRRAIGRGIWDQCVISVYADGDDLVKGKWIQERGELLG